jgi:hypothetical protein
LKGLSIRQPWAWLIANGHKDIENRTWSTHFRGRVLIHASSGMTRGEYEDALDFLEWKNFDGIALPEHDKLLRGGIVGVATITDCVRSSDSPWHMPDCWGFRIADAQPLPFVALPGKLRFFDVDESLGEMQACATSQQHRGTAA